MLGLKRGEVAIVDHQNEWEKNAAVTIIELKGIFGDTAIDIQHIGSTAIRNIKAKPIIDIAAGVQSFESLADVLQRLDESGIYIRSHNRFSQDLLYVINDNENKRTHQIHILRKDSPQWRNYVDFRDYMNAFPQKAKEYENLKIELVKKCDNIQTAYTDGKKEFMDRVLNEAHIYADLKQKLDITSFEPILKGWSNDKKFCITTSDGIKYLLRVTLHDKSASRKDMFRMMQQVADQGVPMCQPVEFGTCTGGVYSLQSWIDGTDAEEDIPMLSDTEQYNYGLESGWILKMIHSIPAPDTQEDWEIRFNRKIDRKIQMYNECPIKYENGQAFIDYVNANRYLLIKRPQVFQHGDYHIGNMMIDKTGQLQIIDFDRYDFGDPWEEFNRIVWCAQKAPLFASGMVNGYFDFDVPIDFWRLLALYISSNTLSSLPWAIPFGQGEINTMLKQAKDVLKWYENLKNPIPSWYFKGYYLQYIDGLPYKLKESFDFGFISKYGKVFKIFDDQDSGYICFGCEKEGQRFFIKFAGAPTERGYYENAVTRLKAALPIYQELRHTNLIELVGAEEIGGGFAMIFKWADGECMGRMYPQSRQKFMQTDINTRLVIFYDILSLFKYTASQGYVAIDFYDGSIMYDFTLRKTTICDIDFFKKMPCNNDMGRMWGSSRFMSPEEFQLGAELDEITNVYTLGATAFALFSNYNRSPETWPLGENTFKVVSMAVSDQRNQRQQSIQQFINEWEAGL